MSGDAVDDIGKDRPRVIGSLDKPDDIAVSLLVAIGRVVFSVACLEKSLQLEATRVLVTRHATENSSSAPTLGEQLTALDSLTAGRLLQRLRDLGLPDELDTRIGAVIVRRNDLVHHFMEDPDLVKALGGGGDMKAMVKRLEELAIAAAELAVELQMFAVPEIEKIFGMSRVELAGLIVDVDPQTLTDARERRQLEAVQAFAELTDLTAALELGPIAHDLARSDEPLS